MNQLREPLNNQQLTEAVIDHEKRIVKLKNKKSKLGCDKKLSRISKFSWSAIGSSRSMI